MSIQNLESSEQKLSNPASQTNLQQQLETKQPTYTDKTNRLQAWSQLLRSITPFIWIVVFIIVIIPLIGR
ncbi:MAG: hypothetical protein F6K09_39470, partial [Merismopedia sp. SIO2A8]|nr:hypothetical protein [Merismopedia sp. SIO2A8]